MPAQVGGRPAGRIAPHNQLLSKDLRERVGGVPLLRDGATLRGRGVTFSRPSREEPYGTVAAWLDLYGNKIDLIEPRRG